MITFENNKNIKLLGRKIFNQKGVILFLVWGFSYLANLINFNDLENEIKYIITDKVLRAKFEKGNMEFLMKELRDNRNAYKVDKNNLLKLFRKNS